MGVLIRNPGWESRLADVIAAAQDKPYVLGAHDCLRFSCACIAALTGVDYWPRFAGYTTKRQALVTIAKIAPSLGEAVSTVLEDRPLGRALARRGDIMLYRDPAGEDHLGVCFGARVGVLAPDGLLHVPLDNPGLLFAWRVG